MSVIWLVVQFVLILIVTYSIAFSGLLLASWIGDLWETWIIEPSGARQRHRQDLARIRADTQIRIDRLAQGYLIAVEQLQITRQRRERP